MGSKIFFLIGFFLIFRIRSLDLVDNFTIYDKQNDL